MQFMKITPCHHFLHVEKVNLADLKKTKGGILLPDNLKEKAAVFQVLAAGPGFFDSVAGKRVPMSVKAGDYVLLDVQQIVNASYAGTDCHICPETAVFAQVEFTKKPATADGDDVDDGDVPDDAD